MKKALIGLVVMLCLCALPVLHAVAMPSPATNIRVWPVGGLAGEDPIVTLNPADMQIYVTTAKNRISSAWILLVLNQETYNGLDNIEVDSVKYFQSDFKKATESKIPLEEEDSEFVGYPGCEEPLQHQIDAVKDKLDAKGEDVYYAIKEVFDYEISTTPVEFTITYHGSSADLKILVLAFGREVLTSFARDTLTGTEPPCPFNNRSSFSGSSLIVVPELATIVLATASLSVFGLYMLKRKNK
jgi:hypothetical protein